LAPDRSPGSVDGCDVAAGGPAAAALAGPPLLRLLQLASPALPIGAFAYSQGLEAAVERGDVRDEDSAGAWILGLLEHGLARLEVPIFARLHRAFTAGDLAEARRWSAFLSACRGSQEQRAEDRRTGGALARALLTLGLAEAAAWRDDPHVTLIGMFTLGAARFGLPPAPAAQGFLFSACENQIAAALRLVPLGQSAGLRLAGRAIDAIPAAVGRGFAVPDEEIASATPGQALLSALHETQYSRLFRS
jgi:urease accessory protein